MTNHKRFLALALVLTMALSLFAGCGAKAPAETTAPTQAPAGSAPAATEAPATEPPATEAPAAENSGTGFFRTGEKMPDFTFTTYDGTTESLYGLLEEKDMVLLNFWATWCGPCKMEFPHLQQAYEAYQDKVAVVALSTEATDTNEMLEAYAKELGLSFYVGLDENSLHNRVEVSGIPASMIIDRFGNICLIESGAQQLEAFENVFSIFTAEDYTESIVVPNMVATRPEVEAATPEELNAALNADGGNLSFANHANPFTWPMTVTEKDGRTVVEASNHSAPGTLSAVDTTVTAKAGDAVVITFKLINETYFEKMQLQVNGKTVKTFTSNRDWITYAHTFEEDGVYTVSVCYQRETFSWAETDNLWIDSITHVTGDAAAAAVKQNPVYPVSDQTQILFPEENGEIRYLELFAVDYPEDPPVPVVLVNSDTAWVKIQLDGSLDPELLCLEEPTGMCHSLASCAVEDGYLVELKLWEDPAALGIYTLEPNVDISLFTIAANMEQVQYLIDYNAKSGLICQWREVETLVLTPTAPAEPLGDVTYTVIYTDQNGDPVPGVMCQVCDDTICQVYVSDANGVCEFTLPAYPYEIHTLKVPDGYEGDTTTVTTAPTAGGELQFTLTKK